MNGFFDNKSIATAYKHSEDIFNQVKGAIKSRKSTRDEYICVFMVGSYGRFEALSETSDIEWLVIFDNTKVGIQEADNFQVILTESIAGLVGRDRLSIGKTFGDVIGLSDLSSNVGGTADTSKELTFRMLCLAEGVPLETNKCYEAIMTNLTRIYGMSHTAGHRMLSFATDISRYWRTLRIDYKYKVDELKKPWAVRGFKLRGARRYWYFSMILHFIAFGPRLSDFDSSSKEDEVNAFDFSDVYSFMTSLSKNPSKRIMDALKKIKCESNLQHELFKQYDLYLSLISNYDVRKELDKISFECRYKNDDYNTLKKTCISMHRIMSDIILNLPEFYRQQAIEMFLL